MILHHLSLYLGSGYYIFVETSGGTSDTKGSFQSPELPIGQEACLNFWYSMYGADMGALDVIVEVIFFLFLLL